MTEQFPVIPEINSGQALNLFQDLISGRLENKPSPQPSPTGEGVSCHPELVSGSLQMLNHRGQSDDQKMLNQVQHDIYSAKRTYSKNRIRPLTLSRKGRGKGSLPFTLHPSLKKSAFTLADGATHVDTSNNIRRVAFTLAEVLITLGIIGIVAAMTMPALITNYQKKQTVAQLKKAYTVLSQAVQRSILDNGEIEYWDWQSISNSDKFGQTYILPYLKGVDKDARYLGYSKGNKYWKSLDGTYDASESWNNSYPMYALPDGMLLRFNGLDYYNSTNAENHSKTHLKIHVDLNGDRGPNRYGRDVFIFSIFPYEWPYPHDVQTAGKLVPGTNDQCGGGYQHNNMTRDQLLTSGCATCKSDYTGFGYGCAAVIMKDGWEIKDDYPW